MSRPLSLGELCRELDATVVETSIARSNVYVCAVCDKADADDLIFGQIMHGGCAPARWVESRDAALDHVYSRGPRR